MYFKVTLSKIYYQTDNLTLFELSLNPNIYIDVEFIILDSGKDGRAAVHPDLYPEFKYLI